MIPKRILWPTDFFDSDLDALAVAADLARASGGELVLLHVIGDTAEEVYGEKTREGKDRSAWALWKHAKDDSEKRLAEIAAANLPGFKNVRVMASFGDPTTRIADLVGDEGIELVVMSGGRKKSRLKEMLLGSVAYRVVRAAPCSVLIVK
jgi:nucleotide-binding universal stress UspA family protein